MKCTPLSGRFSQIGYHYPLQDSAKMCVPVLKCHQLRGGFVPWPTTGGSAPWTPAGGCAPDPRYSLALPRSPYQTSLLLSQLQTACDAAVCEPVCSANSPWTHQDAAASGEGLRRRVWTERPRNHQIKSNQIKYDFNNG